MIIQAWVIFK